MKKCFVPILAAMLLLCGCNGQNDESVMTEPLTAASVIEDDPERAAPDEAEEISEPFSDYTLTFRGTAGSYIVKIAKGEYTDQISVTVENNKYESKSFVITAPSDYEPVFPFTDEAASSVVSVISNDIDDTVLPEIMQFVFSPSQEALDNDPDMSVFNVSRFYTIDDSGELHEIKITADGGESFIDYLDRVSLIHSEPDRFIYQILVDDKEIYDDYGYPRYIQNRVKVQTLTLDTENLHFDLRYEDISEDDPLYFGYAHWAAANSAAQYFIMTTLNVSDYENYTEIDGDYYFKIDDSRFSEVSELKDYLDTIFSKQLSSKLMTEAPQKYRNIDGELYGIVGDGGYDFSLGTLSFSDMEISEDKMVFRSRQELFDDKGKFSCYADGGDFVIEKDEYGYWKVTEYRYPYSSLPEETVSRKMKR
ncbi:MAG: DL-endopeptidase inhibitor IseA family protein [Huintestinicola sp.]